MAFPGFAIILSKSFSNMISAVPLTGKVKPIRLLDQCPSIGAAVLERLHPRGAAHDTDGAEIACQLAGVLHRYLRYLSSTLPYHAKLGR
jgi:hypothetical protein